MSLTEYERLQVLKWFEEKMGPELGANMMKLLPPVGWGDIATKADLSALEYRLDTKLDGMAAGLRGEMAELRGEMAELRGELAGLGGELAGLGGKMEGLSGQVVKTILPWFLGSQAALLAMVGFLLR